MTENIILTADQMRRCDTYTIDTLGVPSQTLMERAAQAVCAHLLEHADLFPNHGGLILALCGGGNNGGDGFATARFLTDGVCGASRRATVCYAGALTENGMPDTTRMSVECRRQYELAVAAGIDILSSDKLADISSDTVDVVVDALFGIGLDRPIEGKTASLIQVVKSWGCPILAVDIPSGICANTGAVLGIALPATATVTMQALKQGLVLFPGAALCGKITVCDIGISLTPAAQSPTLFHCDEVLLRRVMPMRGRRFNKGTCGRIAFLCGSKGMAGAAHLSASAALHTGAGLIDIFTPESNRIILQTTLPEAMVTVADDLDPDALAAHAVSTADGLAVGCGLGTSSDAMTRLQALLNVWPASPDRPLVLDADALNLLAAHPSLWQTNSLTAKKCTVVITPHPGEMARLCDRPIREILTQLPVVARDFAMAYGVTVVLKDAHTVIASPDGSRFLCTAGNAGMATGGSGDTLTGILASLLTQNRHHLGNDLTVAEVAAAGVYLHASAGDAAAREIGEYALTASDIISYLHRVTRRLCD